MKRQTSHATRALAFCSMLAATRAVTNAALYWDVNGLSPGAGGATPSGTWDDSTRNWSADSTGGSSTQLWSPGETATFSAGSDATGQYTVTVSGTQIVSGLTFRSGEATLIPAGGGGAVQLNSANVNCSIGIHGVLQLPVGGNVGLFAGGGGLLTLAAANTYTGSTTVNGGGGLDLAHSQALGATSGVSVASGSALLIDGFGLNFTGVPVTSLNGDGPSGAGAMRNVVGDNTFGGLGGDITLGNAGARIGSDGGTFTLVSVIHGPGPLTFAGPGNINLTGSVQTGTAGVNKAANGLLTLTGSSTNTGTWSLSAGTTRLAAGERIADAAPLSFATSSATFDMAGFNETVGSLSGAGKIVNDNGNLTVGGNGNSTTFGGAISGSGTLTKTGSGTLTLSGENLYGGVTTISGGSVALTSLGRLGTSTTGTVVAPGASLLLRDNAGTREPLTISGAGVNNAGALGRTGADIATYAGSILLAASARIAADSVLVVSGNINNAGHDLTVGGSRVISFAGAISGVGGLIKDGTNIALLLSNSNFYAGNTTVSAGTLIVNGTVANSIVTVNSGATLGGSGVLGHGVNITAGGHIAPGPATGGVATLSIGSGVEGSGGLTLLSGARLDFELATPAASDKIVIGKGPLVLNGQQFSDFTFSKLSGFAEGQFVLIDAASVTGSLGPNTSGFIGTTPATIAVQGSDLVLIAPEPAGAAVVTIALALLAAGRRTRA